MARRGFKINKQDMRKMSRQIPREPDKRPVTARVEVGTSGMFFKTVFNGPVIYGDANGAQFAWCNSNQTQNQQREQIAPGFEVLAQAVVEALRQLPTMGVSEEDIEDAAAIGGEILNEVAQAEPSREKVRRAVRTLKGHFAPIATGAVTAGAIAGSEETARAVIERLSAAL